MDRYKHNASTQRSQRIKYAPNPLKAEISHSSTEKPLANGTGVLSFLLRNIILLHIQFFFFF